MKATEILKSYKEGKLSTTELREKLSSIKNQKTLLSEGQKGLWMLEKVTSGMSAYNLPICFRIGHKVDIELFKKALDFVLEQYPILKTVILEENAIPYQAIQEEQTLYFETKDISDLNREKVVPYIKKIAKEPFLLDKGPLLRAYIFETSEVENIVLINVHHIIFDGVSIGVFLTTLLDAYIELAKGEKPTVEPLTSDFKDFIDWEKEMLSGEKGEEHRTYWKKQLSGILPVLEMPIDGKRHSAGVLKGQTYSVSITSDILNNVKSFAEDNRISLPTFFLGVFKILLQQYSNQEDIIVGMAGIGRPQKKFESLIGYFINMIPIRSRLGMSQSFFEFIKELQLTMLDGMDHADYPFSRMVKDLNMPRTLVNAPVFQVAYFYQNFMQSNSLAELGNHQNTLNIELIEEIHQEGEYELALEIFEQEKELQINMKFNPDLYNRNTIENLTENLVRLTKVVVSQPDLILKEYQLLSKKEQQKVLVDWNKTERAYPNDKCMHQLFEKQARNTPNANAVIFENEFLTYRELDRLSNQLAIYLQKQGVKSGSLVGISMERSLNMLIGLLGILKSGAAYVPLDPEYPAERLSYMIKNSKVPIILTQESLITKMNQLLEDEIKALPLDTYWKTIEQEVTQEDTLEIKEGANHLAYVIYTSGSTGNPKGVMISHAALTNFLVSMGDQPGLTANDKLLAITTYCFDIAGLELYLPLIRGAECHICSTEKQKNIEKLKLEIQRVKPTIMQATPATWRALFQIGWENEENVKVLCGGEALPEELKKQFIETSSEVWNMFGPTETTIWSTVKKIKKEEPVTIGTPIANTQIYILNEYLRPVPVGATGELYIGGDGLAKGYLHLEQLTKERFIEHPFHPGQKIYKTGDSARWLVSGDIEFLGRIDNQVKLHGFRIELDEIEIRLNSHNRIKESIVVITEHNGNKQIRAFYVPKDKRDEKIASKELRTYLLQTLPIYMIPGVFMKVESIPLTPNGKVNRLELVKYKVKQRREKKNPELVSEVENTLLDLWKEVIGIDEITHEDGFFEVGGDSILAVTLAERMSHKLDCDLNVTTIFEHSNIKGISKYISELKNQELLTIEEKNLEADKQNPIKILEEKSTQDSPYPDYYEDSMAIIGISCQFPEAMNSHKFWKNLKEGKESVQYFSKEELKALNLPKEIIEHPNYVPLKLTIEGKDVFDPGFFNISPKDAENMDPQMRLLLLNAWRAVEDAGYVSKEIPNTAVYMSTSNNFYQASDQSNDANVIADSSEYVSWLLGQGGTVPTMISYQLGFKGPSHAVHSNCSSSLVGLYSAYQSLRSGEVDYALVGASTLHSSISAGHVHVPGLNFSSDGHLKAFDSSADGMIGGEGVAVVVLKNAKKAIKDRDNIYSLLRGVGLNNDGSDKVGFYAPSIKGQAEVIKKTLESTKINPETIGYIEAHGTGTKLGDPIEVAGLNSIYKKYTSKKSFCGIGSVKTNIGHLDSAAGLAGAIKVALSLYNNQIPPSLNFKTPNTQIDFKNSPFYVIDQLKELEKQDFPHRAALSSFGIGGTNAHAIFEQYEKQTIRTEDTDKENNDVYLIPLSARNDERLKAYGMNLLDFLKNEDKTSLTIRNIAYTLQVGREPMDSRVIFLVKDNDELIQKLEAYSEGKEKIENCFQKKSGKSVDAIQLLEKDEDSKELIKKWITKRKTRKLAMLWLQGFQLDWKLLYADTEQPHRISLPTYPFAKEKYWKPKSKSNHTENVQTIVANETLHPLISHNISDFTEQKYITKLSGEEFFLVDHIINHKKVLPGVAYIEMGKVAGEMATQQKIRKIKNIIWSQPIVVDEACEVEIVLYPQENEIEYKVRTVEEEQIIIHSQGKLELYSSEISQTSKHIELQEVFDIEACINRCNGHISHTDFYESDDETVYQYGKTFRPIKDMYFNNDEVISNIELPAEREANFTKFTLHPSLLEGCLQTIVGLMKTRDVTPFMPFSIGEIEVIKEFPKKCYVYGTIADTTSQNRDAKKFNLKLYDTQGQLLAIIRNYSIRSITTTLETEVSKPESLETVYYRSLWKKSNIEPSINYDVGTILVFSDQTETRDILGVNDQIIYVKSGNNYKKHTNNTYEINPTQGEDYRKLLVALKQNGTLPDKVLYMSSSLDEIDETLSKGIYAVFHLVKSVLDETTNQKIKLLFTYNDTMKVSSVFSRAINGFAKTLNMETPRLFFKTLQLPSETSSLKDILMTELTIEDGEEISYTYTDRFIKRLQEEAIEKTTVNKPMPFRNEGVYLITGGMGGLGLIIAKYLARTLKAKLVLIGRSTIDEPKRAVITELEVLGAEVMYIKADVSVREDAEKIHNQTHQRFKTVHGIFHCAGTIQDNLINNKTLEEMETVLLPKVHGTVHLDEVFHKEPLDFFTLFSSISHLGNVGQSDYAYANSFLNEYAAYRDKLMQINKRSGISVSINWPIWQEGGMQINEQTLRLMKTVKGIYPLPKDIGMRVLEKSLLQNNKQVIVYYGDPEKIKRSNKIEEIKPEVKKTYTKQRILEADDKIVFEKVKNFIVKTASSLLKIQKVDIDKEMEQYGFDSISNTELANKINEEYKLEVMPTVFFELEQPTIRFLINYLCDKYPKALATYFEKEIPSEVYFDKKEEGKKRNFVSEPLLKENKNKDIRSSNHHTLRFIDPQKKETEFQRKTIKEEEPIAIIGMDGIFPESDNLEEFWKNLEDEKNLVTEIPEDRFDWKTLNDPTIRWGGFMKEVDKFDADFFGISPREAEVMDPQHRLFLQVAWRTIEDAGYKHSDLSGSNTGVFVGVGTQDYSQLINKYMVEYNPYSLTGRTPFMLVNRISSMLNLHGPSEPVDTACSSSLIAVHKAAEAIRRGTCRMALAGGVNVILTPDVHFSFSAAGMLNTDGVCKVFDKDANGTVRSEGVGAVLLKRKSDAIADGDHIYALIKSSAENHKGKSASLTAPNANAQTDLLVKTYQKAKIDPSTINYIETHSTGGKLGDPIEITGLKNAFSELSDPNESQENSYCAIGSLKTNVGHLETASGIAALIKVILSLKNKKLLRTLHFSELNPYINLQKSPFYILDKTRPWKRIKENIPRRAGVSAFGFGGVNAHVLIEEYVPENNEQSQIKYTSDHPAIIVLSAKNRGRLAEQISLLSDAIVKNQYTDADLSNIAYTLQLGREALDERLAFTAASIDELKEKLSNVMSDQSETYKGQANQDDDVLAMLAKDEEIDIAIDEWIKKGKYYKLLNLWVKGLFVDWKRLYKNTTPQRISLPTYPFENKRHWIPVPDKNLHQTPSEYTSIFEKTNKNSLDSTQSQDTAASAKDIILNLFSDMLNTDASKYDLNRPIIDYGVDSIVLTQLLQQLQKIDTTLDFESLYNSKTIQEIVNLISVSEEQIKKDADLKNKEATREEKINVDNQTQLLHLPTSNFPELIRLNKANNERPVFWFHGGFGGVEVYRIIAEKIKRPFYGIQARGYMTDDEPIQGIETMASYYIQMIESVQPEGPYDLGGLSLGGMIAYEVARQLQERGQEMKSIVMLESIYVNEEMKNDWLQIPTDNFKKDRMFRAVNLLLAFTPSEEMTLIPESELDLDVSDEVFLTQLITLAAQKGSHKPSNQLRKSILQLEKILNTLDMSTTFYDALPMPDPNSVNCYYFCNTSGELFGDDESYFRLVDKGRVYDYLSFSNKWKEKIPTLNTLKVEASSHLTLLTEPASQEVITDFCKKLYTGEKISDIPLEPL